MEAPNFTSPEDSQDIEQVQRDVIATKMANVSLEVIARKQKDRQPMTQEEQNYLNSLPDSPYFWQNIRYKYGIDELNDNDDDMYWGGGRGY